MQAQGVKVQVLTSGRRAVGPLEQQQEQMHLQCQEPLPAAAVGLLARLLLGLQQLVVRRLKQLLLVMEGSCSSCWWRHSSRRKEGARGAGREGHEQAGHRC